MAGAAEEDEERGGRDLESSDFERLPMPPPPPMGERSTRQVELNKMLQKAGGARAGT